MPTPAPAPVQPEAAPAPDHPEAADPVVLSDDVPLFGVRPTPLTKLALDGPGAAVYLVLSGCGRLKIGKVGLPKAEDDDRYTLKVRLYRLKTDACCPVTLLGAWPVFTNAQATALERRLHQAAAPDRIKGEWFRCPTWEAAARFAALALQAWAVEGAQEDNTADTAGPAGDKTGS